MSRHTIDAKRLRRILVLAISSAIFVAFLTVASSASAAVQWEVKAEWGDTVLQPGGTGEFMIRVYNIGDTDAAGTVTLKEHLPPGVTATGFDISPLGAWNCFGTQTVTCSYSLASPGAGAFQGKALDSPGRGVNFLRQFFIEVAVSPGATGTQANTATVFGGGGDQASDVDPVSFGAGPTGFGISPSSFLPSDVYSSAYPGTALDRQAGDHPYELRVKFDMNLKQGGVNAGGSYTEPVDRLRDAETTLPRGLVGNPEALPKCSPADFLTEGRDANATTGCPADTQVGYLDLDIGSGTGEHGFVNAEFTANGTARVALYNLEAPKGTPVDLAFRAGGFVTGHIYASLDASKNYAIKSISPAIATVAPVRAVSATIWGVPGDPTHDVFRALPPSFDQNGQVIQSDTVYGAAFGNAPVKPFFTLPMDCGVDNGSVQYRADSWGAPGDFTPSYDAGSHVNVTGCDDPRIRFNPNLAIQPTSRDAGSPTGLDINLNNPQRDQTAGGQVQVSDLYAQNGNQHGIDTPPIKKVIVRMPQGMTISPSAAQGLGYCTPAQIGIGTNSPVTCPDSSQYGTITLHTPILPADEPMHGFIYIAKQNENPFDNFLTLYFVVEDPERGLLVKIPGKVDLDPQTGQITTAFDNLPQFPVSDFQITFKSGVRSALVNPSTCGQKTISAEFYSWADPNTPVEIDSSYAVTQKPDGSPCVNNLADRPFAPQMSAGTVNPNAGTYSPFVFRMTRSDDDQEISQIGTTLPPGLTSRIAGTTQCSDEAIEAAANPARTGTEERQSPSCPASSLIGSTDVGAGVGVPLTYIPGKVYLAGPYKGGPLSLAVITPILAGPYDLGVIVVRVAISVDDETTAIHVLSDPFPQIFQGIPVRLRDIRLKIDRSQTFLNPTNCDPKQITAHLTGAGGNVNSTLDDTAMDLSERFQVANCAALGFKPKLSLKLKGGTERGDHPALRATLAARPGDANLSHVAVTLPHSEFLDQSHIQTICTRVQFKAETCPPGSIYGHAKAWTPLLDTPLEGPVILRSSNHELPDLVLALHGTLDVNVVGRIDSVNGGIRSTFATVPDQPVSKVELSMQGGGKGLLQNSTDLCKAKAPAIALIDGQNGKRANQKPRVRNGCATSSQKRKARQNRRAHSTGRAGR